MLPITTAAAPPDPWPAPGPDPRITLPDVTLAFQGGRWQATAEQDGRTWAGEGDSLIAAFVALLADRLGLNTEPGERPR